MVGAATKADYGLDAPGVVVGNAVAGVAALGGAGVGWRALRRRHPVMAAVVGGWLGVWGLGNVHRSGRRFGMYPPVRVVTATKLQPP